MDDSCQLSRNGFQDNASKSEEKSIDQPKTPEFDSHINGTIRSKTVGEENDDGVAQSNNADGGNQFENSERHVIESLGSMERKTCTFSGLRKEKFSSPKWNVLEANMLQTPHYSSLNGTSEEFR